MWIQGGFMRIPARKTLTTGLVAVGVLTLTLACKGSSNMVSAPEVAPAAASVAGTWTGTFRSDSSACASSQITATFQQSGAQVTGTLSGTSCGTSGAFKGTMSGNQLTGNVEMLGCSGGAVAATVSGSGLSLTMADLTRPIVSGEQVVMYGGAAALQR
jgi:hypothetical protein